MSDVLAQHRPVKRARSSSPPAPDYDGSPLDILLKRRRRDAEFGHHTGQIQPYESGHQAYSDPPESSSAAQARVQGVNGRRARQWERLNAPQSLSHQSTSQPESSLHPPSSPWHPSPLRSYSQPEPAARPPMSSSPVRHHPPSSSPFRYSSDTRAEDTEYGDMEYDEMVREWGEAYATQNSLLHNLHRERAQSTVTPNSTILQTPQFSTPYRTTHHPSSSPYPSTKVHFPSEVDSLMGDDDMDGSRVEDAGEEAVRKRYEETNRLLAELEVIRRQRWGDHRNDFDTHE